MGFIGKFLILVNTVFAVAVLTWSIMGYVNRMQWAEVKYEGKLLDERIKELSEDIKTAQAQYGPAMTKTAQAETDLEYRRRRIRERNLEAKTGTFYEQFFDKGDVPAVTDPRDDPTDPLISTFRLVWGKLPDSRKVLGIDGKAIRTLDQLQKALDDSIKDAGDHSLAFEKSRDENLKLTKENLELAVKTERRKVIVRDLEEQRDYLTDNRVNFDEQLVTLNKRNKQLLARLASFDAGK